MTSKWYILWESRVLFQFPTRPDKKRDTLIIGTKVDKPITNLMSNVTQFLSAYAMNGGEKSFIEVLLIFLHKKMLKNRNFSHKNDSLWIWVQLMKWSLLSSVSIVIWTLKKFPNSHGILIIEWYGNWFIPWYSILK